MGNSSGKERRSFIWRGWEGEARQGTEEERFRTHVLSVLGHRVLVCLWKNPDGGKENIPISWIRGGAGLRPGQTESPAQWPFGSLLWPSEGMQTRSRGSGSRLLCIGSELALSIPHCRLQATFGLLSEPLPQLGPPGAHLFTHCERSAQLCQAPSRAGDSR